MASTVTSSLETDYDAALARQQELQQKLQAIALPKPPPKASQHLSTVQAAGSKKKAGGRQSARRPKTDAVEDTTSAQAKSNADANASSTTLPPHQVPMVIQKIDTHWDYILKEMQWLSTDFTAERKRHAGSRRKLANGVKQFFHTKEARALTALTQAEGKRRKLAARMGRQVQKWWNKMDQMVTYQQKLTYDQERHKAMNRKLVKLVQQTERYTQSLVATNPQQKKKSQNSTKRMRSTADSNHQENGDNDHDIHGDTFDEQVYQLRIEEALAMGQRRRKVHNYATLAQQQSQSHQPPENTFYGESTTEDSGSDGSYCISSDGSVDDETTLQQAESEEPPAAMRDELVKLRDESRMDIDSVLTRLQEEPDTLDPQMADEMISLEAQSQQQTGESTRRVQFAKQVQVKDIPKRMAARRDPGEDADDDQDDSDVEDFVVDEAVSSLVGGNSTSGDDDEDEYFISNGPEAIDDETTMEEEEQLPQEMTAEQELDMLRRENEMSVEELRAMYSGALTSDDTPATISRDDSKDSPENDSKLPAKRSRRRVAKERLEELSHEEDGDDEFQLGSNVEVDDETTIEAEEKMGRDMSYADELALLQSENEMPIEQLRAMYAGILETSKDQEMDYDEASSTIGEPDTASLNEDHGSAYYDDENDGGEDDEFQPGTTVEADDETTIEAEEKLGRDMSYADELAMLERENEMPIEELQAMYSGIYGVKDDRTPDREVSSRDDGEQSATARTSRQRSSRRNDTPLEEEGGMIEETEVDEEFQPMNEVDDETTIAAEERLGREMSYAEEIAMLNRENEMSVEELRAMYSGAAEEDATSDNDTSGDDQKEDASKRKRGDSETSQAGTHNAHKRAKKDESSGVEEAPAFTALEKSTELAKNTLATRPFLLANWVKLREYQQVGLNWLVSMQSRRLNGILADEVSKEGMYSGLNEIISKLIFSLFEDGTWKNTSVYSSDL